MQYLTRGARFFLVEFIPHNNQTLLRPCSYFWLYRKLCYLSPSFFNNAELNKYIHDKNNADHKILHYPLPTLVWWCTDPNYRIQWGVSYLGRFNHSMYCDFSFQIILLGITTLTKINSQIYCFHKIITIPDFTKLKMFENES